MIRWIWGGAILMGLGGLVTVFDRRYRAKVRSSNADPVSVDAAALGKAHGAA